MVILFFIIIYERGTPVGFRCLGGTLSWVVPRGLQGGAFKVEGLEGYLTRTKT